MSTTQPIASGARLFGEKAALLFHPRLTHRDRLEHHQPNVV
jgi:hypothetical protein